MHHTTEPTDFVGRAATIGLRQMFRPQGYFDICTVRKVAQALGRVIPRHEEFSLSLLHCVSWADMPPGMRQEVLDRTMAALGYPAVDLEVLEQIAKPRSRVARIIGRIG